MPYIPVALFDSELPPPSSVVDHANATAALLVDPHVVQQQMRALSNLTLQWTSVYDDAPTPVVHHRDALETNEVTQAMVSAADSPVDVAMTILTVFVLSPLIICSNSLFLAAFRRYKRLRTPSNCLVASLALADTGVGLFLPLGVYFELTRGRIDSPAACLLPYCALIAICGVSLLSMAAIALDRYTSLARPLRYNNIITKASVGRYVTAFWAYALLVGTAPLVAFYPHDADNGGDRFTCSFDVVGDGARVFLFCTLFAPCALVVLFCYAYVYIVARYHAHAIYSVELSVRQNSDQHLTVAAGAPVRVTLSPYPLPRERHHTFHPRYGRTLALTVGLFFALWTPFQVCVFLDAVSGDGGVTVRHGTLAFLAFAALVNSALNPWVYGYRNTEFRLAYQRILEDLFAKVGVAKKKDFHRVINDELGLPSCASNVRLSVSPNHLTMTTTLLKPTVTQDTTSVANGTTTTTTVVICETVIATSAAEVW